MEDSALWPTQVFFYHFQILFSVPHTKPYASSSTEIHMKLSMHETTVQKKRKGN